MIAILLFCFTISTGFAIEQYEVTIHTADERYAGTNADVRIRLFGNKGSSGIWKLHYQKSYFERGSIDFFKVYLANDIGDVNKIHIGHDNNAILGSAWKINKVLVKKVSSPFVTEFPLNKWLENSSPRTCYVSVEGKQPYACGITATSRVVNGVTSSKSQWPWQAQFKVIGYGNHHCGGTLIHPQYVLTASHCVDQVLARGLSMHITLGEHNLTRNEGTEQVFKNNTIFVHELWDRQTLNNDIALVKLERPVMLNKHVQMACLPSKDDYVKGGERCYVSGWGRLYGGGPIAKVLQHAYLPSVSQSECDRKMRYINPKIPINENMLCGGGNQKSGCHGDSGGPYVCQNQDKKFYVQGAVSWGSKNCQITNSYTVFARVTRYIDWIESHLYNQKYIKYTDL